MPLETIALQRNTTILLAIAIVAGAVTAVLNKQFKFMPTQQEVPTIQYVQLLSIQESELTGFSLTVQDQQLVFQQQFTPDAQWWLMEPEKQRANRGAISFLMALLQDYQGEAPFPITAAQLADYGLEQPYATLVLRSQDGSERQLTLGDENFDQTKVFGRLDQELQVWVLPLDFKNAVTRELTEWVESASTTDVADDGD